MCHLQCFCGSLQIRTGLLGAAVGKSLFSSMAAQCPVVLSDLINSHPWEVVFITKSTHKVRDVRL